MSRVVGPPAVGASFFNREGITKKVHDRLKSSSILLVAPRRFGKTSIMWRVKEILDEENILALYLDIEHVQTPSDLMVEILNKAKECMGKNFIKYLKNLPKGIIDSAKENIESVEIPGGLKLCLKKELQDTWKDKGRELLKLLRESNSEVVLFLDEFPLMLHNMYNNKKLESQETVDFLYWLRSLRIELHLKMVLGGSIGIDHILRNLKASASINDLERIIVGPFDQKTAEEFLRSLLDSEKVEYDSKSIGKILEIIGEPIPYFLQVFMSALLEEVRNPKISISAGIVEEVYKKRVLGIDCKTYFDHYFERLSIYYDPEEVEIIRGLLRELAAKGSMPEKELFNVYSRLAKKPTMEQFRYLVSALENEFYLAFDSTKRNFRFATRVLRDLWVQRYEVFE